MTIKGPGLPEFKKRALSLSYGSSEKGKLTLRCKDAEMNENLMKDGIERIVNGLPEENLGVFASLRGHLMPWTRFSKHSP